MPKVAVRKDIGDALNDLYAKVRALQQQVTGPAVMGVDANPSFTSIDIGGIPISIAISPIEPAPGQTALAPLLLVPGAYMDDIFIDVSWSAPADGTASTYEVEMAKQTAPGVFSSGDIKLVGGTNVRFRSLEPNTTYGFRVTAKNAIGVRNGPTPAVFQTASTGTDTTIPPQVTGVIVARGATTAVVKFTPLTVAQAGDVANGSGQYQVQISTSATFASIAGDVLTGDQILAFNDILAEGSYYARVRAIDASGNIGPWSATAGPALAGGVIDAMVVAGLDAAKITVGFLSASRIQAGTLTADKLTTSSLTSANITINGGALYVGAAPFTNGIVLNSQGLRCYDAGVATFILDSTGTATFSGTVSAATILASSIFSSYFYWPGGHLTTDDGLAFRIGAIGFETHRAISWIRDVAPWTGYWAMYCTNASEMYIERRTIDAGDYSWLTLVANRIYAKDGASGTNVGNWFYNGSSSFDHGLQISGYMTASNKSFIIDHPLDPEHMLLQHGCLEGPEFGVYYRGQSVIGAKGYVDVALPPYFDKLTIPGQSTVQLTPIDSKGDLYTTVPKNGTFRVSGQKGQKFFWLVHGVRADGEIEIEYNKEELAGADAFFALGKHLEQGATSGNR